MPEQLASLDPAEQVKMVASLLPYVLPKLTSVEMNTPPEQPVKRRPDWLTPLPEKQTQFSA